MENNKNHTNCPKCDNDKKWPIGRIFWGLLLIILGGLLIIDNFNLVNVNWLDLWRLWPLIIIAIGLSVLSIRSIVWKIFTIILAIVTLIAVVYIALGNYSNGLLQKQINIDQNGIHIVISN